MTTTDSDRARHGMRVLLSFIATWFALALIASAAGVMLRAPTPVVPLVIWSGPIAFAALYWKHAAFRAAIGSVDLRAFILFHVLRAIIGAWFTWLVAAGALTPVFGMPAGWGDIAAGVLALPAAVAAAPPRTAARRWLVAAWNALALLDIVFVFITAQRVMFFGEGREAMLPLVGFPGSLIPTFVVGWVYITHFIIFARLRSERAAQPAGPRLSH